MTAPPAAPGRHPQAGPAAPSLSGETLTALANLYWLMCNPHGEATGLDLGAGYVSRGDAGYPVSELLDYDFTPGPAEQGLAP